MLSIWKEEGKEKCSWQQIIDALVCGSIYEVVDSAPEIFCQSFEDMPKRTDQKSMSDLIKVKHKLEECECSLLYDMRRIEDLYQNLNADLQKKIGSNLRERWNNMKIATQRLGSIPVELESCISLLKYSANVSKPVSETLNDCVTELLEFSKELDPSISKIRPSFQICLFLCRILLVIAVFVLLASLLGALMPVILGRIREFFLGMALGCLLWGITHQNKTFRILQIVITLVSVLVIVFGLIYGMESTLSLLAGTLCLGKIATFALADVQMKFLPDTAGSPRYLFWRSWRYGLCLNWRCFSWSLCCT